MRGDCEICSDTKLFDAKFSENVDKENNKDEHLQWYPRGPSLSGFVEKIMYRGSITRAINSLRCLLSQFFWYVFLKNKQARAYSELKIQSQLDESTTIAIQMDFSEKFSLKYQDAQADQSVYSDYVEQK